ncbi:hypothetical protein MrNuV_ORF026 [Macrobrachium rosenbergii nudivirus]|nr:hypothetical protein MrNuV_ORF026 [Macrobrachium rosenbergii nudivirus]
MTPKIHIHTSIGAITYFYGIIQPNKGTAVPIFTIGYRYNNVYWFGFKITKYKFIRDFTIVGVIYKRSQVIVKRGRYTSSKRK